MALDDNDWKMIGAGAGGILLGFIGGSLFTKQKPVPTGLSRLFRMKGLRKSEVAIHIMAVDGGYTLEYDAPYGIVGEDGEHDDDLDHDLFEEFEDEKSFLEPEDAAERADEIMDSFGYTGEDHWTDTIEHGLKDQKA